MDEEDGRPEGLAGEVGCSDALVDAFPMSLRIAQPVEISTHPEGQRHGEEIGWGIRSGSCRRVPFLATPPPLPAVLIVPSAPAAASHHVQAISLPPRNARRVPQYQGEHP
ncbi:MAG TPA: hypothetical protein VKB38_18095 [Terracidiphilus sp.]|nr:hypothetical protein [Terracidiphilus sp.]